MTLEQKPSMNPRNTVSPSGLAIGGGQFGCTHPEFIGLEQHEGNG